MQVKKLYRSRENRMICGVAGGLGAYLGVDPTIVRLLFVVAVLAGFLPAVVGYVVCCLVIPDAPIVE